MSVRIAAPNAPTIVPAFTVRELEGTRNREIIEYKDGKRSVRTVEEPMGYLVTFPTKGNSIHVRNARELARLNFDKTVSLVSEDPDDDRVHAVMPVSVQASARTS